MVRNVEESEPRALPAGDERDSPRPPEKKEPQENDQKKGPPWYKRRWVIPATIVLGLLLLAGGIFWIWYARKYESTDDAYTAGHVVEVSAEVSGRVQRVLVDDNDNVKTGQVIVELDPRDYESELREAQATLKVAQAERDRANAILKRFEKVNQAGAASPQDYDESVAAARKADAQVADDEAQVAAAQLKLSYTKVIAPFAGRIARKEIEPGAYITPGQAMMALVDPQVWVEANFKETQLKLMKPGDPVRIKVDAFPQKVWRGHVDSVQPGSGAQFSLLPPENATGNFVKIVQRVPVKIVFDDYVPGTRPGEPYLGVGLSVKPRVTVR